MPGRSLTFHFELSVGSIVLRKFSGGGASCQLDPNNAHDKKKRVHMSHTQTLPGRGGLFMGSDEKLPILQLKTTTNKVRFSLLVFSCNNLRPQSGMCILKKRQSPRGAGRCGRLAKLACSRPLKLQLIHVSLSLKPLGCHICKHCFFNVETFAACGARCYLTSARFGCSRRSPAHARSQHKPCFVPRRLHQKPSKTPKRC